MSKGEQKIFEIFSRAGINFKQEVSFKNLNGFGGKPLRFDFAIYDSNWRLLACLDFDGIQHFQYTPHFQKTKADFRKQLEYDIKKNKFCLLNKIPFIRIPYWDLETLTINKILYNQAYYVKNKNHNLNLIAEVRK